MNVIAIEFLCASQAIDLRDDGPLRLGEGTRVAHGIIRKMVQFYDKDREMTPDISRLAELIETEEIITAVDVMLKKY
jgi:histidine ammonia-lyase